MNGKRKSKKKIWIAIIVLVVLAGMVALVLGNKKKPKGTNVDVAYAKLDTLVQTVSASGKIQPAVDVNISANVSGRIIYLGAEEGDQVQRGQLLVRIEDDNYKAMLQQTQFALRSAEASLEEAQSILKRVNKLHSRDLSSDADLETSQAAVKRLEAEVDRARASVDQADDALKKTRIFAPIEGTVTRLNKESGEMAIGADFTEDVIMVVSQLDAMEVNVEVNENDVVLVAIGDPVEIEVFAIPDTTYKGVVSEIGHSGLIQGTGTAEEVTNFEVKVSIVDKVEMLRPGMSATVDIETDRRNDALVLPQECVAVRVLEKEKKLEEKARKSDKKKDKKKPKSGSDFVADMPSENEELVEVVYVVRDDSAWVSQVRLGIYSDTHFEILSGIEEGDLIVTGPFRLLSRDLHSGTNVEYSEPDKEENDMSESNDDSENEESDS